LGGRQREPPRGITFEGVGKHGQEMWRLSVYLGFDVAGGNRRIEHRERIYGPLEAAITRRDAVLAGVQAERWQLAAGVRGKTMADLLDADLPVWRRTPRKGHPPAPKGAVARAEPASSRQTVAMPPHRARPTPTSTSAFAGRLKARLRPMRGLKRDRSARTIITGHALVQNVRRGHYELAAEAPVTWRVAVAFAELAAAI
jgi:hypothetical protein